jgi:hypothetical protein
METDGKDSRGECGCELRIWMRDEEMSQSGLTGRRKDWKDWSWMRWW